MALNLICTARHSDIFVNYVILWTSFSKLTGTTALFTCECTKLSINNYTPREREREREREIVCIFGVADCTGKVLD